MRVDGSLYDLGEEIKLEKNKKHNIEIIVDRLVVKREINQRLTDSIETAAALSGGLIIVNVLGEEEQDLLFSQKMCIRDRACSSLKSTARI